MTPTLDEIERVIPTLSVDERARLLRLISRELNDEVPGIQSTPGVCGGEPCVRQTRIPVWLLEQARRLGETEAQLLLNYAGLRAEDLANAWAYVRAHPDEIDLQIRENEQDD